MQNNRRIIEAKPHPDLKLYLQWFSCIISDIKKEFLYFISRFIIH